MPFQPAMADQSASPAELPGLPVTALQHTMARTYVGVVSTLFALSTLILALRLVSRWKTNRRLEVDDYFIASASVSRNPLVPSRVPSCLSEPPTPLTILICRCRSSASLIWQQ